jgi:hypothetical protein
MHRNQVWIANNQIFQARPIEDVVNDGHPQPDNVKIKWVIFRVFTVAKDFHDLDFDAVGYATTLANAKAGVFAS